MKVCEGLISLHVGPRQAEARRDDGRRGHQRISELANQQISNLTNKRISDLPNKRIGESANTQYRKIILAIAAAELGVREATGRNDGNRVEEYLRYTGLGKGHPWCAAFVSWCFRQAGLPQPRTPWSPALFPNERTYFKNGKFVDLQRRESAHQRLLNLTNQRIHASPADIFGIYGKTAKRINHVGLLKQVEGRYIISIEGNSNDRVESRRRHLSTIYALADWL